ncbi:hypothetical protein T310_6872, partial [Rasamsonia emersonii CBS 393.64]
FLSFFFFFFFPPFLCLEINLRVRNPFFPVVYSIYMHFNGGPAVSGVSFHSYSCIRCAFSFVLSSQSSRFESILVLKIWAFVLFCLSLLTAWRFLGV